MNWLKYFFLSIFFDKQAKRSVKYGFGTALLTCLLAVVFIFLGLYAAETVSFAAYFKGADEFQEFISNAFNTAQINIIVKDNQAQITANGEDVVIDTVANESDKAAYSLNGYNLFVDSRQAASTFDDFRAYCQSVKDGTEISYDEYLSLSTETQKDYAFRIEYSGRQKIITDTDVQSYREFLSTVNDNGIQNEYKSLNESANGMPQCELNGKIYALYVKAYYPQMYNAAGEQTPTLRGYYIRRSLESDGKYVCLFKDMSVVSFKSYCNNTVAYGGIYKDGNNIDFSSGKQSPFGFFKRLYYDGASTLLIVELLDCFLVIAIVELIIVAVIILTFAVCRLKKLEAGYVFGKSVKLVASYAHTAALLTFLAIFCLGFLIRGTALTVSAYVIFALIMLARTAVLLIKEAKYGEKHIDEEKIAEQQQNQ